MNIELKPNKESGVNFYPCPFCWYTTKSKSSTMRHINVEHQEEKEEAENAGSDK